MYTKTMVIYKNEKNETVTWETHLESMLQKELRVLKHKGFDVIEIRREICK